MIDISKILADAERARKFGVSVDTEYPSWLEVRTDTVIALCRVVDIADKIDHVLNELETLPGRGLDRFAALGELSIQLRDSLKKIKKGD